MPSANIDPLARLSVGEKPLVLLLRGRSGLGKDQFTDTEQQRDQHGAVRQGVHQPRWHVLPHVHWLWLMSRNSLALTSFILWSSIRAHTQASPRIRRSAQDLASHAA